MLLVPSGEKDQAKALGAQWDQRQKRWWISSSNDLGPFARWLQPPDTQAPLYRDLRTVDMDGMKTFGPTCLIEVFFCRRNCWKCRRETLVFHGAANRSISITHLFYQAQVIEELETVRQKLGLEPFACIKPRWSRTTGENNPSQGCRHCDALMGAFPLWEDFIEFFNSTDLDAYQFRKALDWWLIDQ